MNLKKILALAGLTLLMASCAKNDAPGQGAKNEVPGQSVENGALCEVSSWRYDDVAAKCKPGQKVGYFPQTFGNEQIPVIFAAVNCDLRYNVVLTNGAVTCIYGPITPRKAANTDGASSEKQ